MLRSRHLLLAAALAMATPLRAQGTTPLHVIRVTPFGDANVLSKITVTFDRPVAGSLDRTVDATTILSVVPAIPGKLEWRDPVTIQLIPSGLLVPAREYAVTIANGFHAMDGSTLPDPYRFTFRVGGPQLLAGVQVGQRGPNDHSQHVPPNQPFDVVYSSAADLAQLGASAFLEFSSACGGQQVVRLAATSQRAIRADDPYTIKNAGRQGELVADSLRRVIRLTPQGTMPRGCAGDLVLPMQLDAQATRPVLRWGFTTYGDFQITTVTCENGNSAFCATGPLTVHFSTPVSGAEVDRHVHLLPATKFAIRDSSAEAVEWTLDGKLKMHTGYAVVVDTSIRDVFGQRLQGNPAAGYKTTGYEPLVTYAHGRLLVERVGYRTLAVEHANVDTLIVTMAQIPETREAMMLGVVSWGNDSIWNKLKGTSVQKVAVRNVADVPMITGIRMPTLNALRPGTPTLFAVKVDGRSIGRDSSVRGITSLVQVSDLGVHAKIGATEGVVWVTGVSDGSIKSGATVVVHNSAGKAIAIARTDAQGIARFAQLVDSTAGRQNAKASSEEDEGEEGGSSGFEGYVSVTLGTDRAVTAINQWDPDLSPYHFNVYSAWGDERYTVAGALFTERGIYKPGERVFIKEIVRNGALGTLRAPTRSDSVKLAIYDREGAILRAIPTPLSVFGTADYSLDLPASVPVGQYQLTLETKRQGKWLSIASASYRVAEYRPPEFLVDLAGDKGTHFPGDTFTATAQARYLFGAPMGRAQVTWSAQATPVSPWALGIPGTDGWYIGDSGAWWEDEGRTGADVFANEADTLDARGTRSYSVTMPEAVKGRAARVTISATVTDINRLVVGTSTSAIVHPAEFYIAARTKGVDYFWKSGTPQSVGIMAVRPNGQKVPGVDVKGTVVRREWHRVRRVRDGVSELVGEWVSDTTGTCTVSTTATEALCTFTPKESGSYTVTLSASDRKGHIARTSFQRWASGPGWVPWSDETQFKMDVIPDRTRYAVGDTATIMFASPFTDAEAWITIEREGLIDQRRIRITSGSTTMKFPITEAFAPNVFVSILVARGRSAKPGYLDDLGRPTIRVGYAELRVTPETKRLAVAVKAEKSEYRPADTTRVGIQVRDRQGRGQKSEVTLWAVDEGVLALTDYKTPDPLDLLYRERGLGMRLASNMTTVAPQVPEGEKGWREPGGGGGAAGADILRSRFKTTAFFLGSVITDANGNATATAALPDNITTFRVMAVAVTAGDRYGKGESKMLVTRPLLARQALPRFVRPGDQFTAGAVINRRDGAAVAVTVSASATGAALTGPDQQTATLAAQRGREMRFPFTAARADSASFRFDVSDRTNADAVRVTIPVRPEGHPVTHTLAGVLHDTATVDVPLPAGMDLDRSRLSLSVGMSPLAMVRGMLKEMRVYPYYCSEQVISAVVPIIALARAQKGRAGETLPGNPKVEMSRAVDVLSSRQRADGGIGYWASTDWTSAWLTAYAGIVMLDARDADAGVRVDTLVLHKLAAYLTADLHGTSPPAFSPVASWMDRPGMRFREQIAAVDFLSRYGRPDVSAENELLRSAAQLSMEDRARLAEVLMRRRQAAPARALMAPTWALIRVEGRRAVLPDSARPNFYFESRMRPYARILQATLAIDPENTLVGPLVETLAQQTRAESAGWMWNTQDYASSVSALSALDRLRSAQPERTVRVRAGDRVLMSGGAAAQDAVHDSSIALAALVASNDKRSVRLSLDAGAGQGALYYYLSVSEVAATPPGNPLDHGIQVDRWYEKIGSNTPISTVAEGDLVRVRLKITVPALRYFVVLDDALPAGLEAVDLSLRTASASPGPGIAPPAEDAHEETEQTHWYGMWDSGWWSPFDHREIRDDRVVYSANMLWAGSYTATYIARATTPGTFIRPPAHAEEMYNAGVNGRSDGGTLVVTSKAPPK